MPFQIPFLLLFFCFMLLTYVYLRQRVLCVKEKRYSEIMGGWKLEYRNWIFGFHAFLLLMNAFDLGPSFISPEFLISSFKS